MSTVTKLYIGKYWSEANESVYNLHLEINRDEKGVINGSILSRSFHQGALASNMAVFSYKETRAILEANDSSELSNIVGALRKLLPQPLLQNIDFHYEGLAHV